MIEPGRPGPLGASCDADGANFALWSGAAERVELCLFDVNGRETQRHDLPGNTDGTWHGFLHGCNPGTRYGYRVHGPYAPSEGLRFNPNKLLIDPYARELAGAFRWSPEVYDYVRDGEIMRINESDSAPYVPKSVVTGSLPTLMRGPAIPWAETIIYETNVRGFTMRHPLIPQDQRGTFRGMRNTEILEYLKSLGITSIELMPVHEFIDEAALVERGQRNYWGYNSINFFTPPGRYSKGTAREEFREMTNAMHDAGFEVLLDVAYNHTGETSGDGPTVCFRGIDNLSYYRTVPGVPGHYINYTGCGNTINACHPRVRELILDSLRYWATDMGVDGFRFDLATITARDEKGFSNEHPLLQAIASDNVLKDLKFIAEPWDVGPHGYQLGNFPVGWSEWNDRYRDSVRRFWRGDDGETAEIARRLHGSSDLFESSGRGPAASINFISAHDGFTLADLVSYEQRNNEANGEGNRDGHSHNFSCNYGVEGETNDARIIAIRRKQRLNMLATLLFSQGTPMLLAGDEFGNSQQGNNNAYGQDNETGWVDWSGLDMDPAFQKTISDLIVLRRSMPLVWQNRYLHDDDDIEWRHPDGRAMHSHEWSEATVVGVILRPESKRSNGGVASVALLMNPSEDAVEFMLAGEDESAEWRTVFSTSELKHLRFENNEWHVELSPASLAVCLKSAGKNL